MLALPRLAAPVAAVLLLGGCARIEGWLEPEGGAAAGKSAPTVVVDVEGTDAAMAENIRAHLEIAAEPCDAPEWRVRRLLTRAEDDVRRALRALGHYQPEVTVALERDAACWHVRVRAEPGSPVRLDDVDVRVAGPGADDPELGALVPRLRLDDGERLDHGRYDDAKQTLIAGAAARGYLDAQFSEAALRVDVERGTAAVRLVLDTGRRYRFGKLNVEQDALAPDVVDRFTPYEQGAPYDSDAITTLNRTLTDSGYFAQVDVRPQLDQRESGEVPVDVTLVPRQRHAFSAGLGATTDTGPRAQLGYENRLVNRRGHRFTAKLSGSLVRQELGGEYRIPLADPRSEWLSLQGGYLREETDTAESTAFKLAARQTTMRSGTWLETRFIEASRENFTIGTTDGLARLVVPGISWSRASADDELSPSRGWRVGFELSGTDQVLGSNAAFMRGVLDLAWIRRLPWGGRVLARSEIGAMLTDDFDRLPPSRRFFTGGDTSVRGYGYQELGPRDSNRDVIGGRYLAVGSLEYEHPVRENWSVAGFVDAGNAFDNGTFDDGVNVGIGAGVRWRSPIGPVRVDLAHPLDEDTLVRLHLRLGPDL